MTITSGLDKKLVHNLAVATGRFSYIIKEGIFNFLHFFQSMP
uniref:Uncharacterized protein n=1 Tax=Anguilla anguilla TaxID=7936 RepID=A0A0E9S5K9_ANGAN